MATSKGKNDQQIALRPREGQWVDTLLVWIFIALGGAGLWISVADPIFGGPEVGLAALTMFGFFAAAGAVATFLIWCSPGVWKQWFHRAPAKLDWRLEALQTVAHAVFWVLALTLVVGIATLGWSPMAAGAAGGCLVVGRLVFDLGLHCWLGRKASAAKK